MTEQKHTEWVVTKVLTDCSCLYDQCQKWEFLSFEITLSNVNHCWRITCLHYNRFHTHPPSEEPLLCRINILLDQFLIRTQDKELLCERLSRTSTWISILFYDLFCSWILCSKENFVGKQLYFQCHDWTILHHEKNVASILPGHLLLNKLTPAIKPSKHSL